MTRNAPAAFRMARTITELRALTAGWKASDETLALVPTMGALHEGHLALIEAARHRADRVIVSIFVNPTQFAPNEDFGTYPRNEARDLDLLIAAGADGAFLPTIETIYPRGDATRIEMKGPALGLETDFRPHFFGGVATVVARLLLAALPHVALFGEKDYQQLMVIKRMVADLHIPVSILGMPTVRETDGLALSSRNAYLSAEERAMAPVLHATLQETAVNLRAGEDPENSLKLARSALSLRGFKVDYVACRNADTLAPVSDHADEPLRLLAAAWLGKTRLIDNIPV